MNEPLTEAVRFPSRGGRGQLRRSPSPSLMRIRSPGVQREQKGVFEIKLDLQIILLYVLYHNHTVIMTYSSTTGIILCTVIIYRTGTAALYDR